MLKISIKYLLQFFIFLLRTIIVSKKNHFFCIPDDSTKTNCCDIINYTSDNTLSFINYFIKNYDIPEKIKLYIVYYDLNRKSDIENWPITNNFIDIKYILSPFVENHNQFERISLILGYHISLFKSTSIISSNVLQKIPFKKKNQKYFSLNYYTPFKYDKVRTYKKSDVDFAVSTSNISSQIVANTSKISIEKFHNLGFPRNDNIISCRMSRAELLKKLGHSNNFQNIILYTPTHRYHNHNIMRTNQYIFGYNSDYEEFNHFLVETNSIIFIKQHPSQHKYSNSVFTYSNIVILKPSYEYTLYDILAHTDVLITDYTSTYFDFLLTLKPVIFNFYDFNDYSVKRGFSHEPIEAICAGPIVKSNNELIEEIKNIILNKSSHRKYLKHKKIINSIFNKHQDANSSSRFFSFFNKTTN